MYNEKANIRYKMVQSNDCSINEKKARKQRKGIKKR